MTYYAIISLLVLIQSILILKSFLFSKNLFLLTDEISEKVDTLVNFRVEQKSFMSVASPSLNTIDKNLESILEKLNKLDSI